AHREGAAVRYQRRPIQGSGREDGMKSLRMAGAAAVVWLGLIPMATAQAPPPKPAPPRPPAKPAAPAAPEAAVEPGTTAVIETEAGAITIKLLPAVAPKPVQHFVATASKGGYAGNALHRVIHVGI